MLAVDLPPDLEERLDRLSRLTGRSVGSFAQEAILDQINDLEDAYLAADRLENLRSGRTKSAPLEHLVIPGLTRDPS